MAMNWRQRTMAVLVVALAAALSTPAWTQEGFEGVHVERPGKREGVDEKRRPEEVRREQERGRRTHEIDKALKEIDPRKNPNGEPKDANELERLIKADEARTKAEKVLARIERGEPDPHWRDGSVFRNNEGKLPKRETGYYKEYVYRENESDSVGRERVVVGRDGDVYYTEDHYETFTKVK